MAPEMIRQEAYQGPDVDLFALAVVLFNMVTGTSPFVQADTRRDRFYRMLTDQSDKFWLRQPNLSNELKELLSLMLNDNPTFRPNMADVIGHDWLKQGESATAEEVEAEMQARRANA